jgi:ubiquinone/menaquinone biosynthesis C-methylase UbiE
VLHHLPPIEHALRELARVLVPNGRLHIVGGVRWRAGRIGS